MSRVGGQATAALDKASQLGVGKGRLDLWGFLNRDAVVGRTRLGGGLDYTHRISTRWSAFGRGWIGAEPVSGSWAAEALAGIRVDF